MGKGVQLVQNYYLNNIINPAIVPLHKQNRPNLIFTDDNASAHQGRIINERLLETGVPQMEWPAFSLGLNPIENLHVESAESPRRGSKLCTPEPQ